MRNVGVVCTLGSCKSLGCRLWWLNIGSDGAVGLLSHVVLRVPNSPTSCSRGSSEISVFLELADSTSQKRNVVTCWLVYNTLPHNYR